MRSTTPIYTSILILFFALILALFYYPPNSPVSRPIDKSIRLGSGRFFDLIATKYDTLNKIISLGLDQQWRNETVQALHLTFDKGQGKLKILDVATGTADVAIAAIKIHGKDKVEVVGIDPSAKMIKIGETKIMKEGLGKKEIDLQVRSVEELGSNEIDTYDGVTVAFGVRNFADRLEGLSRISKVMKRDAKLVIIEVCFTEENGFFEKSANVFAKNIMPILARFMGAKAEAYRYLADSMSKFPNVSEFKKMAEQAGLRLVNHKRLPPFGVGPVLYTLERSAR